MKTNRGVVFKGPGKVVVESIPYPTLSLGNRSCEHGVILKVVLSAICGSDQHMVRGRTTASSGLVLGHEITGQVVQCGRDVEFIKEGDLVSVPFNVACGRCVNCIERKTNICLHVNPSRPGGAYGYVDMGGWVGGQAEYVMVPYADFNLLKLPPLDQIRSKIEDIALLADIFPTAFHGAYSAGVRVGSHVYIAGAGPVGLSCAVSCKLIGAARIIIGDLKPNRLERAQKMGYETLDLSKHKNITEEVKKLLGSSPIDAVVDCVGFEAYEPGSTQKKEKPAVVLNEAMRLIKAGGGIGIPGLYVTDDPGAQEANAKEGYLSLRFGLGWSKAVSMAMGQTPVMCYNRQLLHAILNNRCVIAETVGTKIISLDEAPEAYKEFDKGASYKYLIDPHGMIRS
jgi:glutathione-independent formaldehyde dehydrogenase